MVVLVGRRRKSKVVPSFMGIVGFGGKWLGSVFFPPFCKTALILEPVCDTLVTPVRIKDLVCIEIKRWQSKSNIHSNTRRKGLALLCSRMGIDVV